MRVDGRCHAPAALSAGMTCYPLCRRLGGPSSGLDRSRKPCPHRDLVPGLSST